MANLGDMVVRIVGDNAQFDSSIDRSQRKFTNFAQTLTKVGRGLTMFVTAPLAGIGVMAVRATANMEDMTAALTTMLGSGEAAQKMLSDLTDFAAKTPFQLADLAGASKLLLAFGVDADRVMPSLQMLGDIAQGNSQRFGQLSLAFAQIQSTGRLMGQDLLQLINAGFNPLTIISEKTGQSMADLKKQMEQGAISAEMVTEAFEAATSEGGRFFGGMERASQTFNGLVSTLKDNISLLGIEFGEMLLPALKDITESTIELVQKFQGMDTFTKSLILRVGGLAALLGPLALGVAGVTRAVGGLNVAMAFLAANPAVAVIGGLSAIALGLRAIGRARRDAALDKVAEEFEGIASLASVSAKDIDRVQQSLQRAGDAGEDLGEYVNYVSERLGLSAEQVIAIGTNSTVVTKEYRDQLEVLRQQLVEQATLTGYQDSWIAADRERAAANARAAELRKQEEERATALNARYEQLRVTLVNLDSVGEAGGLTTNELLQRKIDLRQKEIDELIELAETGQYSGEVITEQILRHQREIDRYNEKLNQTSTTVRAVADDESVEIREVDEYRRISAEAAINLQDRIDEANKLRVEAAKQRERDLAMENLAIAETMFDQLSGIYDQLYRNRSIAIDNTYQKEREAIENSTMDEETKAARLSELDEKTARERRKLARKEAAANKAFALFEIPINTAVAVTKLLARPILAAAAAALGAAQFATVAAQPLPALAQGGIVMPSVGGTVAQVAEAGQPEVIFPLDRLEQFLSSRAAPQPGGSAMSEGNIHLTVNMDSKPILDKIFPATRNRQILIDARAVV